MASCTSTRSFASTATTPYDPDAIVAPPVELDAADLVAAVDHAAATVRFTTNPHPANGDGWHVAWGEQVLAKVITDRRPAAPMTGKGRAEPPSPQPFGRTWTCPDCGGSTRYRACPTCTAERVAAADTERRTPTGPPASHT